MSELDRVVALLTERLMRDGAWRLTLSELEDLFDPVTLYRAVYELKLIGRDAYDESCAGELVTLLEHAVAADAEARMRDAGLFLNHDDRIGLTERFVRHLQRLIVLHLPEPETFRAMLRQFRQYEIAQKVYCDTYLDTGPVVRSCAAEDAEGRPNEEVFAKTAEWYLGTLLQRRIVTLPDLGPALFELLRTVARQEGALPKTAPEPGGRQSRYGAEDRASAGRRGDAGGADGLGDIGAIREALELFGLGHEGLTRARVQVEYRRLMRRYHPDVNPDGLEMAKRINAAYGVLLSAEARE